MELRLFGPPGTGKTTRLAERIEVAAKKFGRRGVIVSSFTRAAAREIASRTDALDPSQVGTLHALCYHALNRPDIAEGHIDEFNKEKPHFALSGAKDKSVDDPFGKEQTQTTTGDELMRRLQNLRARMVPKDHWPGNVKSFSAAWEAWKEASYYYDFTDLIDRGIKELDTAPGDPRVGIVDESQDMCRHQMTLIRRWAKSMDYILMAGDDDQLLYNFSGATPDAFLEPPIPDKQKEILTQSYRIPAAVHRVAEKWITQIEKREPKEYRPRDYEGEATIGIGCCDNPRLFLNEVEQRVTDEGETVMILASCSYLLNSTIAMLREKGLPFHNPYRKTNGAWNPLQRRRGATMTVDRLAAFTNPTLGFPPVWSMEDIAKFSGHLRAKGTILHGAKMFAKEFADKGVEMPSEANKAYLDMLRMFFEDHVAVDLFKQLNEGIHPEWYLERVLPTKRQGYDYPMKVLKSQGDSGLLDVPKIIVGSVHSVKGGESDNVYFMPDLSAAGMREWTQLGQGRDAIVRMAYVAMTRAKKRLRILRPAGSMHVDMSRIKGLLG